MKSVVWLVLLFTGMMLTIDTRALGEPNALKGKRLYRSYCLVCHGADGPGAGPLAKKLGLKPANLSSKRYQEKEVEEMTDIVGGYERIEGSDMPSWGTVLPRADLRDIAAYIATLPRKDLSDIGDTRRGRAIYKSACIACHGQFGTGNGVLTNLIGIPVIDHTDSDRMNEISDDELTESIRDGLGDYMASWRGTLSDSEITDVAAYIRLLPTLASERAVAIKPDPLDGRRLYRAYCLVCHGVDGKSAGPLADKLELEPADLSSPLYHTETVKELATIIAGYGRKEGSKMPVWGAVLPLKDLHNVSAYITRLVQVDLCCKGDERRGRAIFNGACLACHGQSGAGKGYLAQLIDIPMTDFTDFQKMYQISDEELITAIREGKGAFMPSWQGTYTDKEIIDVAAYIRALSR